MQVVVTMTVLGVLLTVSGTALVRMYKQQTLQLERIAHTSMWQRLSRDFRDDVHAALSVTSGTDDGKVMVLAQQDQTVTWFVVEDSLRRVVTVPGSESEMQPDPGQTVGETYRFPDTILQLSSQEDSGGAFAVVEMASPDSPTLTARIEAHVGRDQSFSPVSVATTTASN